MSLLLRGVMTPIRLCDNLPIVYWYSPKHTHTHALIYTVSMTMVRATVRRRDGAVVVMGGGDDQNIFTGVC